MATTSEMNDNQLCEELIDWCRVARNEGGLRGKEREHLQSICKEINQRGLLKKSELSTSES
jgi:hypothetical protein